MIFLCNFNDIGYTKFLITLLLYKYNFENHYWTLHIQYQFIITIHEILLNTTQNKKINWFNSIS